MHHRGRLRRFFLGTMLLALVQAPHAARAQVLIPEGFTDQLMSDGLSAPVGMAFLPDGRLLVVEQISARIWMLAGSRLVSVNAISLPSCDSGRVVAVRLTGSARRGRGFHPP